MSLFLLEQILNRQVASIKPFVERVYAVYENPKSIKTAGRLVKPLSKNAKA
jgi:hypothetical protein